MRAPRVVGKFDDNGEWSIAEGKPAGNWLLPAHYELSAALIARALAGRLAKLGLDRLMGDRYRERVAYLEFKDKSLATPRVVASRLPYFCSPCPHNTSTKVPAASRAMAPIGRHFMPVRTGPSSPPLPDKPAQRLAGSAQPPLAARPHARPKIGGATTAISG